METSESSAGMSSNPWTFSPEDSPARISHKPESMPASRELAAVFGLSSPVWFGNFDHDLCSLKTFQVCLFTMQCDESLETWPDSGMWDAGVVYELANSAPVICESASSSWPTANTRDASSAARHSTMTGIMHPGTTLTDAIRMWPTASASLPNDGETPESWELRKQRNIERHHNGNGMGTPLTMASTMWPTARQEDGESCGNHPDQVDSLTGAAYLWPTPNVPNGGRTSNTSSKRDDGSKRQIDLGAMANLWRTPDTPGAGGPRNRQDSIGEGHQVTIAEQAEHWQTPGTDSFRSRGGDRKDEMGLDQEARNWITPNARDWKSETGSENNSYDKTPNLSRQVYGWWTPHGTREHDTDNSDSTYLARQVASIFASLPAPPIPDGPQSSESDPTSRRRLNPRFVEWLMGFPIGWTEP